MPRFRKEPFLLLTFLLHSSALQCSYVNWSHQTRTSDHHWPTITRVFIRCEAPAARYAPSELSGCCPSTLRIAIRRRGKSTYATAAFEFPGFFQEALRNCEVDIAHEPRANQQIDSSDCCPAPQQQAKIEVQPSTASSPWRRLSLLTSNKSGQIQ